MKLEDIKKKYANVCIAGMVLYLRDSNDEDKTTYTTSFLETVTNICIMTDTLRKHKIQTDEELNVLLPNVTMREAYVDAVKSWNDLYYDYCMVLEK